MEEEEEKENKEGRSWKDMSHHKEYQEAKNNKESLIEIDEETDYKIKRYGRYKVDELFIIKSRTKEEFLTKAKNLKKKNKKK